MTVRRSLLVATLVIGVAVLVSAMVGASPVQTAATLPSEISDKDFWSMIVDLSEPGGTSDEGFCGFGRAFPPGDKMLTPRAYERNRSHGKEFQVT